jgi:hypothetical protein
MSLRLRLSAVRRLACAAALLAGCPGGDDDGGTAGDGDAALPGAAGAQRLDVCDAHLSWVERCQGEPDFSYDTEWGLTGCPMLPWRYIEAAYIDSTAECFETLRCTETDDTCTEVGFRALDFEDETDVADDALLQRCLDLRDSCDELNGDACTTLIAFTDAGRNAAVHCLDLACDRIEACLHDPD